MPHKKYRQRGKHRFEFSKVIVLLAIIMWIAVNVFGMVMIAITRNLSPMVYIIGSVDAVMAVVVTFYSRKATAENVIKLKRIYGIDTTEIMTDKSDLTKREYRDSPYDDYWYGDSGPMYEDTSIV